MMKWSSFFSVLEEIEKGKIRPVYLIQGPELYLVQQWVQAIKEKLLAKGEDSLWNFDSFGGEELSADKLNNALETLPGLFSGADSKRLVVCTRAEKLNASCTTVLEAYFKNPSESSCLVVHAEKWDGRKAWVKAGHPFQLEVRSPYDREWPQWKEHFEGKLGKKIESSGWQQLVDFFGKDLSILAMELSKIAIYVGKEKTIRAKDIALFVSAPMEEDLFRLIDQILAKDKIGALNIYRRIAHSMEDQNRLIALWIRQLRILEECRWNLEQGVSDPKILGPRIGVSPFFVPKTIQQAKAFSSAQLKNAIHQLAEADYGGKTGQGFYLWENFLLPLACKSL